MGDYATRAKNQRKQDVENIGFNQIQFKDNSPLIFSTTYAGSGSKDDKHAKDKLKKLLCSRYLKGNWNQKYTFLFEQAFSYTVLKKVYDRNGSDGVARMHEEYCTLYTTKYDTDKIQDPSQQQCQEIAKEIYHITNTKLDEIGTVLKQDVNNAMNQTIQYAKAIIRNKLANVATNAKTEVKKDTIQKTKETQDEEHEKLKQMLQIVQQKDHMTYLWTKTLSVEYLRIATTMPLTTILDSDIDKQDTLYSNSAKIDEIKIPSDVDKLLKSQLMSYNVTDHQTMYTALLTIYEQIIQHWTKANTQLKLCKKFINENTDKLTVTDDIKEIVSQGTTRSADDDDITELISKVGNWSLKKT